MKISFHGACSEVTGSCHLVDTGKVRFLVDCGMFQGHKYGEEQNYSDFGFNPKTVDFVILTHAHVDHCGRLPKLFKDGFSGPIYATQPTRDFVQIILDDAAKLVGEEAKHHNHEPLYLPTRIPQVIESFKTIEYRKSFKHSSDITIEFYDAGHILGSVIAKVTIGKKELVFSGDLGNPPVPLLRDTEFVSGADAVILESTYGGRIHEQHKRRFELLRDVVTQTISRGGVLMIPSFALERTQELLYELNYLVENNLVPTVPIFLDSPLAIKATQIYKNYPTLYDKEAKRLVASGDDLFHFPRLEFTTTSIQSKKIYNIGGSKIIIAGSGMMNGGRIKHHLRNYLGNQKNHLLIIGYQVQGTLGRKLLDGATSVNIHKRPVNVKATVSAIGAYSAHADQPKLVEWVNQMSKPKPKKVFIVHGEKESAKTLSSQISKETKLTTVIPEYEQIYDF
ncbi:MBL fold metallo-hydrolase [Patescibacteria group bacterium]|nr:MBL fold metallo-hydrolase [Patescibacteria group bacterium]